MKREKTGDSMALLWLRSQNKLKWRFYRFLQLFVASMSTRVFGSHPSVTNLPVKGSSIIALTNLPSKLSTTEKQWAIHHASSRR